jgi:predicted metal-dependent HD superfamily phosphohydrolase
LAAAYANPARGYHDLRHLQEVLAHSTDLFEAVEAGPRSPHRTPVLLAAWFHDAVYTGREDDEERSAQLAEDRLPAAGVEAPTIHEVARLVRLTRDHRPVDGDLAGGVLCDADLAVLAAGPERYAEYVAGVRREYAHVADDDFRRGRAAVLQDLLDKRSLFHTAPARARWEDAARANVVRELEQLREP